MSVPIIHVINCLHREDRLLSIAKEARDHNFALCIWQGIYSGERKDTKRNICLTHKAIIRYAKQEGWNKVLIAEDDMQFFAEGAFSYFLDSEPENYDMYCGLIYSGEVNQENRIVNGASGILTLYSIKSSFYDVVLNDIADDSHLDREIGNLCHKYKIVVPPLLVCKQSGSYSDQLKKSMDYSPYLENRKIYGRD